MQINCAPWKYRNILDYNGGPISKIECSQKTISLNQFVYEAYAYLKDDLFDFSVSSQAKFELYGNCHGTGSNKNQRIAIEKAISESLERWAFFSHHASHLYGFDYDATSSGMAAFPGIIFNTARENAMYEAVERWALAEWWAGKLSIKKESEYFIILTPFRDINVVVRSKQIEQNHKYAYGFAAHKSLNQALYHAEVELFRNIYILSQNVLVDHAKINTLEKRVLFFASIEGFELFKNRIASPPEKGVLRLPATIFDGEIPGPWSKYATVWRVVLAQSTQDHLSDDETFFHF